MEAISLTTPALLFSAISLIMLAYTNRFLAYASIVRSLYASVKKDPENKVLLAQIKNLRKRLYLTQAMQILGIGSLFLCVVCMYLFYVNWIILAETLFGLALICLILSLGLSILEIRISVKALDIQLSDMVDQSLEEE